MEVAGLPFSVLAQHNNDEYEIIDDDVPTASQTLSRQLKQAQVGIACCEEEESDPDDDALAASHEPSFHEKRVQIAMDSGAGKNVTPPELIEGYAVQPSYGSRHNKHFVAANGGKILNLGEATLNFNDGAGSKLRSNFQVAEVSRMLYSVSQICDTECEVHFNKSEGTVIKDNKIIARFPRKGGLYVMETTLKAPAAHQKGSAKATDQDFIRPVK
jgi:hypothetical protein